MSQIMFEVDYPHGDSTWPNSRSLREVVDEARLREHETYLLARGNAIRLLRPGPLRHHRVSVFR